MRQLSLFILFIVFATASAIAQIRPVGTPILLYDDLNLGLNQPIPSPGSDLIALTGPNYNGIWVISSRGDNLQKITSDRNSGFGMKWSADNNTIVSRVSITENRRRYFAVKSFDVGNAEENILIDFRRPMQSTPLLTSDESSLIIAVSENIENVSLPLLRQTPEVSARMRSHAHASGNSIYLSKLESPELIQFQPLGNDKIYMNASASPDGSKIAFEVYGGSLYVLNTLTGDLVDFGRGYQPSWSPDGTYITFMVNEDDGYKYTYSEIVASSADGTDRAVIYSGSENIPFNPVWDPNYNRIYFDYYGSGSILYIEVAY